MVQGREMVLHQLSRGALALGRSPGSMRGFMRQMRRHKPDEIILVAPYVNERSLDTVAHYVLGAIYDHGGWTGTLHKYALHEAQWQRHGTPMAISVTRTEAA